MNIALILSQAVNSYLREINKISDDLDGFCDLSSEERSTLPLCYQADKFIKDGIVCQINHHRNLQLYFELL